MKIVVIDGQGGGIGRALVEQMKKDLPGQKLLALGTNVMATAAMLRAGADHGATGENAILVNARDADLILGPIGIVIANAMMGELSPRMAEAVGDSGALKILIPVGKCLARVAGAQDLPLAAQIEDAVRQAQRYLQEKDSDR